MKANLGFWLAVVYSAILLLFERIFSYAADIDGTIGNPFVQGIWFYLAIAGLCLLIGGKTGKIIFSFWLVLHTFGTILACWLAWVFRLKLTGDAFFVLATSSVKEVKEFFSVFVSWKNIAAIVFVLCVMSVILFFLRKVPMRRFRFVPACILILPFLINCIRFTVKEDYSSIYDRSAIPRMTGGYFMYRKEFEKIREMERDPRLPEGIRRIDKGHDILGILVIGESATRNHMGNYGYPRENTPFLEEAKKDLLVFDDVISPTAQTVTTLRCVLTTEDLAHKNDFRYTVLDVLRAAGYHTSLLSNQYRWGRHDGPITLLMAHADERRYFQEEFPDSCDEVLLPEVQKKIREMDGPTMLILHLIGSHTDFSLRYPSSFQSPRFDGKRDSCNAMYEETIAERINEYDNSIAYTDMILGKLIRMLGNLDAPAYILYFSDHGETPEHIGARSPTTTFPSCYEIPFVFYSNARYRALYPDFISAARKNLHSAIQTDCANWSILSSAQITFDGFPYEHDLFSAAYRPPAIRVLGGAGNRPYRKSDTPAKSLY